MASQLIERTQAHPSPAPSDPDRRQQIKRAVRQRINQTLQTAQHLPPQTCLCRVRSELFETQSYCQSVGKSFILVEESVTCDQYDLGGTGQHAAVLFRGPREDASVAICVTAQGSLLHRNEGPWRVYRNMGDVSPEGCCCQNVGPEGGCCCP